MARPSCSTQVPCFSGMSAVSASFTYAMASALPGQRGIDRGAEMFDRLRPFEHLAVDEERRRAGHAQRARLGDVRIDVARKAMLVQTLHESVTLEPDLHGVLDELIA